MIMLHYNVVFSDLAITDLSNIVQYIAEKESHERAKYVERKLLKTAKYLENFPNINSSYKATDTYYNYRRYLSS